MTDVTPREKLEFNISNKPPLIGTFNGHSIAIERIRLSEITDTWSEIVKIMRTYQSQVIFQRSKAGGDSDEQDTASEGLFDILDEMGPGVVKILHAFVKSTSDITEEMLEEADFHSLTELVIIILEHNVDKDLMAFFGRGASVLRTLRLLPESPDTKESSTLSGGDGHSETSKTSTPEN